MSQSLTLTRERVLENKHLIDGARMILREEFVGIDGVIEAVLEAVTPWFIAPELQERPLVTNLWGLTGTGKTTLVMRLGELLGMKDRTFHCNLGSLDFVPSLFQDMDSIQKYGDAKEGIIVLDEFQNARTINERGEESEPANSKNIWNLLDSGVISYRSWFFDKHVGIQTLRSNLHAADKEGLSAAHGQVSGDHRLYSRIMGRKEPGMDVLSDEECARVAEFLGESPIGIKRRTDTMDWGELLAFMDRLSVEALRQKTVDCRKALVFVIGNLDEAFNMNGDIAPDLEPDGFREASLRITIPRIKLALQKRFRNEQIARLGNTHIVYPAFGSGDFRRLIRNRLREISEGFCALTGIEAEFEISVEDLIYGEGVYPAQGARPLLSTIERIAKSALGRFLGESYVSSGAAPERFVLSHWEGVLSCRVIADGKEAFTLSSAYRSDLGKLRESRHDDLQALASVHEAGHATLAILLLGRIPDTIRSSTSDPENHGFISGSLFDDPVVKEDTMKSAAVLLGGRVAEALIFGESLVTGGAAGDIAKASGLVLEAVKLKGFGGRLTCNRERDPLTTFFFHNGESALESVAKGWLDEAEKLSKLTLIRNRPFFIEIALQTFDRGVLRRKDLEELISAHLPGFKERSLLRERINGAYSSILSYEAKTSAERNLSPPAMTLPGKGI